MSKLQVTLRSFSQSGSLIWKSGCETVSLSGCLASLLSEVYRALLWCLFFFFWQTAAVPPFLPPWPSSSLSSTLPVIAYCMLFNDTVLKISSKKTGKKGFQTFAAPEASSTRGKINLKATTICPLNLPVTSRWLCAARANHTSACPGQSLCDEARVGGCASAARVRVLCEKCYRHAQFKNNRWVMTT